ncbi:hypothetical protein [Actinomyces culturomici]|uniref:hypothetical protein n=1 Tax=Actinomyces culturomici TaxID=1926276 RepID=UPI000E1FFB21|nr:hypothetical protein [Actinomyces culturomici]
MELGGIIIIAAAVALFGMIPLLVARRTAMTQTREGDRYSQRLRLLENDTRTSETCERSTQPILALKRTLLTANGDVMAQAPAHRPVRVDRAATQSVREIARLRARRAARLSAEAAAGRRRLLVSTALAALTLVVGVVAYATALTWPWTLIPGALLAVSLVASRVAAVRSEKIGAAELELLNELREKVSPSASRASADSASADSASAIDEAGAGDRQAEASDAPLNEGTAPVLVDGAEEGTAEAPVEDAADAELVEAAEAPAGDESAHASVSAEATEVDPIAETAPVERRTWNVASVPAPTYAIRGRISGRSVHPDTDLRGIPKVEARVPARPVRASALSGARSTSEVVADQAVALDLDAVLDARRAQ